MNKARWRTRIIIPVDGEIGEGVAVVVVAMIVVLNVLVACVVLSAVVATATSAWRSRYHEPVEGAAEAGWR